MTLRLLGITKGDREVQLLTLPVDRDGGVPPHAIVGEVDVVNGTPVWASFRRNRTFVDFFTSYMRGELSSRPGVLSGPPVKPGEYVYVIDKRADTPKGDVPFSEIVGWYTSTREGHADAKTFKHNEEHFFMRSDGKPSEVLRDPKLHEAAIAHR